MRKGLRGGRTRGTCDRCGVEKTIVGQGVLPDGWMVLRPEVYSGAGPRSLEIQDLCPMCRALHAEWMKGDENVQEDDSE